MDVEILVDTVSLGPFTDDEWRLQQEERLAIVLLLLPFQSLRPISYLVISS